jgi:L-ribulokinase
MYKGASLVARSESYALGLDFGTESVRAILAGTLSGRIAAEAVVEYPHGVITERLPGSKTSLPPDWALQHPQDYLNCVARATKQALRAAAIKSERVCGIGVSFTACTMLPALADGTPLCMVPKFAKRPNAWVKLWKHHASQPQADKINELARKTRQSWLKRYGGIISSEWFIPKALQALEEDPAVYHGAHVFIEAGEWLVWQLTGQLSRSTCHGGYKQCWHPRAGYPKPAFLGKLHREFGSFVADKMPGERLAPGTCAGHLTAAMARKLGLPAGLAVSPSIIDAHSGVPGSGVAGPDVMVMVMGTSTCHMLMSRSEKLVAGISGVVPDGILPGYFGYEAGQVAVGDIFAWYVDQAAPAYISQEARKRKQSVHDYLSTQAAELEPGQTGLLTLDWWNGNRTPFVDANLSGLLVGMTLATKPHHIYRALLESTAFGTMWIIELFDKAGLPTRSLVACGGIAQKNPLLVQIYADVTGRNIAVAQAPNASSLGAAILGAIAAGSKNGGHSSATAAVRAMCQKPSQVFRPNKKRHAVYQKLYEDYKRLSNHFGRHSDPIMAHLRNLRSS